MSENNHLKMISLEKKSRTQSYLQQQKKKIIKYLEVNLAKEVKVQYTESCNTDERG